MTYCIQERSEGRIPKVLKVCSESLPLITDYAIRRAKSWYEVDHNVEITTKCGSIVGYQTVNGVRKRLPRSWKIFKLTEKLTIDNPGET